jgi:hypothetical protein
MKEMTKMQVGQRNKRDCADMSLERPTIKESENGNAAKFWGMV